MTENPVFMFCHNPRCRFHMQISEAVAMLGEIEYWQLEQEGYMDIFDNPGEVKNDGKPVTKKRYRLNCNDVVFLCEDCMNAFLFAYNKYFEE